MKKFLLIPLLVAGLSVSAADRRELQADFKLPRLSGGETALSDYRGQWVVVNYWATWCTPCRKEIPELSELHAENDHIVVLGLAYEDTGEAAFEAFLEEYDPSYPILLPDVYDMPDGLENPRVLPTTFLVDQEGYRVKTFLGPITRKELEAAVEAAAAPE